MSIIAGTTVTTLATLHVASAGACTSFVSGTYLGTWQVNSGPAAGASGAGEEVVTFSGSSLSGSVSFVTGTTAVAAGDTLSGTVGCNSFSGTLDNFTFNETSSTATNLSGTFSDNFGDMGTWAVGLAYDQVSNPSTTSLTTGSTTSPSDPIQSSVTSPAVGSNFDQYGAGNRNFVARLHHAQPVCTDQRSHRLHVCSFDARVHA